MNNSGNDTLRNTNRVERNGEKSSEILVLVPDVPLTSCVDKASVDCNHLPIYN